MTRTHRAVIDYFALGLIHLLLAIALVRLVRCEALDSEEPPRPLRRDRPAEQPSEGARP